MATKTADYDFVEESSEDFYCPVTFDLLREPHQTLCCGNHLSQETVSRLSGKSCPICKKPNFGTVPDMFYMRRVNELKLYCPNKSLGCEWVGELGSLDRHLKELQGKCQYAEVACEFSYAGCRAILPRKLLQAHLSENVEGHLSMVAERLQHCQQKSDHQQSVIVQLQDMVIKQQQQIEGLVSTLSKVHLTVPDIIMTDFEEHKKADGHWFSPPFYSHIGGYKICLEVVANGFYNSNGTHVSVFIRLMRGEHDDQLKWPFRGEITIWLLNQRRDEGHWEKTFPFDDRTRNSVAGRVVGRERATSGRGYDYFIAHAELNTKDKKYLQNDRLKFRILKISVL